MNECSNLSSPAAITKFYVPNLQKTTLTWISYIYYSYLGKILAHLLYYLIFFISTLHPLIKKHLNEKWKNSSSYISITSSSFSYFLSAPFEFSIPRSRATPAGATTSFCSCETQKSELWSPRSASLRELIIKTASEWMRRRQEIYQRVKGSKL